MRTIILMVTTLLYSGYVSAEKRVTYDPESTPCPMIEQTQVNINFNSREADLKQIKDLMDGRVKEIEAIAKEVGIEKMEMQSMNYNVYANNYGNYNCFGDRECKNLYQLNGSMNFKVEPADKAIDLMDRLNKKGYQGGMNVNMYRRCH